MKVVVTGATGFVGEHLVWRLASSGDDVTCLVRPDEDASALLGYGAQVFDGHLSDPRVLDGHLDGVEAVYHCAETIHGDSFQDFVRPNVDAAHHVAQACAARPRPPTLIVMSSLAAAGPSARDRPHTETSPTQPITPYGRSKLAAEGAVRAYAGQVPISIVRPAVVFGERDRETLPYFQLAQRGWLLAFGPRDEPISVIHVADLAHAVEVICLHGERLSATGPEDQGVYLAAKDQTSFGQLGGLLAEALHRDVRVISAPGVIGYGAAALLELTGRLRGRGRERVDLSTVRAAGAGAWLCDPAKLLKLPFKLQMSLAERLQQTLSWYREAGWLDS